MGWLLLTLVVCVQQAAATVCDVLGHGAQGDNRTDDTAAVAATLRACAGGTVLLPRGHTFLIQPIELPSNTHLIIDGDIQAWPEVATWPNSTVRYCTVTAYESKVPLIVPKKESLLWAVNSTGVTVSGVGTVHGGGEAWWAIFRRLPQNQYWHNCRPSLMEFGIGQATADGPAFAPRNGRNTNLVVRGITLSNSPFWTFVARGAENLWIDDVHVTTPPCDHGKNVGYTAAPNTDGFNIGSSNGVLITDSSVRNRDDCVPLFPPINNVTVLNITCSCGNGLVPCIWPAGSLPGHGGNLTNIVFDGARFFRSNMAVAIKSLEKFVGTVKNVSYSNFVLENVGQAIMMNVFEQGRDATHIVGYDQNIGVSSFESIRIENISGTASSPGKFLCAPEAPCSSISMRNVRLNVTGESKSYQCASASGTFTEDCRPTPCLQRKD